MFKMLSNLTKAAVAVVATPAAVVADIVTLPASSMDFRRGPFDKTAAMLKRVGDCVEEATKPDTGKDSQP